MKLKNKLIILAVSVVIICATIIIGGIGLYTKKMPSNETTTMLIIETATKQMETVEEEFTTNIESSTEMTTEVSATTQKTTKRPLKTKPSTTTKTNKTEATEKTTQEPSSTEYDDVEYDTNTETTELSTETLTTSQSTTNEVESTVKPASAFYLSDYERRIVECIVMGEAGYEPYKGQVLVAQCIFNACKKDGLQPSGVKKRYKYSGWHNNPSQSVKNAVSAVFDDGYKETSECILYFYAPKYCTSKWHESQKFVCEVGGHRFFAQW